VTAEGPPPGRGRLRDHGIVIGALPTGPLNALTDVPGVRVGHVTVWHGDARSPGPVARTGVTAIWPHDGDPFRERVYAGSSSLNGYGVSTGELVLAEWGLLAAPIVLTDTRHIGVAYDATVTYLTERDPEVGTLDVAIPVVLECDAGFLSDNRHQTVRAEDVHLALESARAGPVAEGCVGAGTGTQQFDFKGGIGTSSRVVDIGGNSYTVGVLLQTNYGSRRQLSILGHPIGRQIPDLMPDHHQEGSCVGIVATDIPLNPLQLQRLSRRVGVGLARTGSVGNDGSGEIFLAFSVANQVPRSSPTQTTTVHTMIEGQFWTQGSPFDVIFEAVAEATEEAALNALFQADTVVGRDGNVLHGAPIQRILSLL
jgi:D-aminopeptidase